MQYICLIYTNEADEANITKEQEAAMYAEYNVFGKKAREAGVMVGGEAFHPTDQAKTVRRLLPHLGRVETDAVVVDLDAQLPRQELNA